MLKITGLDEFQRKLEQLQRNAERIDGNHQVPLVEVFPPAFMRQHSSVADFETFCRNADLDTSSEDAFAAIPLQALDNAVRKLTDFQTWEEMKKAGATDWAKRRLFDGLGR